MSGTSGGEEDIQLRGREKMESNKIPFAGEAGETKEESDTNREEDREGEVISEEPTVASVQERILNFEKMFPK